MQCNCTCAWPFDSLTGVLDRLRLTSLQSRPGRIGNPSRWPWPASIHTSRVRCYIWTISSANALCQELLHIIEVAREADALGGHHLTLLLLRRRCHGSLELQAARMVLHAMPCHAMPCHTVQCHSMPCHAIAMRRACWHACSQCTTGRAPFSRMVVKPEARRAACRLHERISSKSRKP